MNICSVIVHVKPDRGSEVQARLERFPGVEVHGGQAQGKLIVTIEDSDENSAVDTMAAFNSVKGVIGTTLIYHYGGNEPMGEEVIRESHSA